MRNLLNKKRKEKGGGGGGKKTKKGKSKFHFLELLKETILESPIQGNLNYMANANL